MIAGRVGSSGAILLIGAVRGLVSEAERTVATVETHAPRALGLGLSKEELAGFEEYFVGKQFEPAVPLTRIEAAEVQGLSRFGDVRVPNPVYLDLAAWARPRSVVVAPLDPSDDRTASLFTDHIGYFELVRRTVRERRLSRSPPPASTPDGYALAWDEDVAGGRGSRRFAQARDETFHANALRLAHEHDPVALVIDRERFDGVKALFDNRG